MSNLFNVVLTGELLKGQSIMQAANSLSKLFKIAPIQAQQMLARAPLVIKKNLEEDTAIRFVQAMYKSGFGAAVEEQKATKTTFLQPFASHLDDEDDEEAAVTRITPVLVEQSRLEESLDTELTIPAATTPAPSSHAEPTPEPLAAELLANSEQSNQLPEEIAGLPLAEESAVAEHYLVEEIDAFDVAPPAAQVQELSIEQVSAEQIEPELLAGAELSEEPQANIAEEVVQLSAEDSVDLDEQQESPSEPFGLEAEFATEVSAEESSQEAEIPSRAESFDPFGQWHEPALEYENNSTEALADLTSQDYLIEDTASAEPMVETQGADEEGEIANQAASVEIADAPVEAQTPAQWLAAELDADLEAAETAPIVDEPSFGQREDVALDSQANQDEVSEPVSEAELVADEIAEVAELASAQAEPAEQISAVEGQTEEDQSTEIQSADVQWLEPVAQWQTVAELAEDMSQEQGFAASYKTAEQTPEEVLAEQVTSSATAGGGDHFGTPPIDFVPPDLAFEEAAELPVAPPEPAHWDDAVEISPALTERLAQIAEESKKPAQDAADATADLNQAETFDLADGVLLFEAADVTEISSASWDDWHPSDAAAVSGAAAFNPLLDFDQVVPDWQNTSLDLSFDATSENHHNGLTAENEQELAAFLDAEIDEPRELGLEAATEEAAVAEADHSPFKDDPELEDYRALEAEPTVLETASHDTIAELDDDRVPNSAWAHEISVQANCGFLEVIIPKGRELHVAAAASVTMGLSLHEQLNAGSSVRAWLLAKGFVINTYEAIESAGSLGITAITHGMICAIDASDFPVMVQQSAYLASTDDVQLNADQSRLNPVVSASKWIHCSGTGELWLNAQGLWEMVEVDGCYRINSRYLMAYSKSLELKAPPLAGLKSYLTSGSGVECRLTGRGVVWVQTEASRAPVIWQ